jgi:hypothetical protein
MTPDEVLRRISVIQAADDDHDDERAHAREDELYRDVLSAIAEGRCGDPAECARLALTTQEINFNRWCA